MATRYMPGDVLSRRKGFVMHKGVALGGGRVLHNSPFRGEHVVSEHEFLDGKRLHVKRLATRDRMRALRAAESLEPRSYSLLSNNCEHTVTRVTKGRADSPQLRSWAAGIGIGALAFALTRHPGAAVAGYALGRSLVDDD